MYDNIFDIDTCAMLHELAVDHSNRCESGSIFVRTSDQVDKLTPLEKAVDTILNSLNDTSPIVEYWSRSCYINIDAHADIDENTLKEDGVLRCPRNAHVLYLNIANSGNQVGSTEDDRRKRMGPTVVFPERKVAWGSVTRIQSMGGGKEYVVDVENYWDENTKQQYHLASDIAERKEEMAIVPAKTGRLLRFDGRAFHAVPKPPHRYVMSSKELNNYLEEEEGDCDENENDDYWEGEIDDFEEEETDAENLRSVLLFNTWQNSGPRGVLEDKFEVDEDDIPDDIELYSPSYYEHQTQMEYQRNRDFQEKYGDDFERVECNKFEHWEHVSIDVVDNEDSGNIVTVPLMGNPSRRGCTINKDILRGSLVDPDAFYHSERVSLLKFQPE